MRRSDERILTTHAGSLPRPENLIELNRARRAGEATGDAEFAERLRSAVAALVRREKETGVDVPNDVSVIFPGSAARPPLSARVVSTSSIPPSRWKEYDHHAP